MLLNFTFYLIGKFLALLPWNLVTIQSNINGFSLIEVNQNSYLSDSFDSSGSDVIGNQCSWYQYQICFGILFSSMCRMCPTQRNWAGHTTKYIMYNPYAVLLTCRKCSLIRRQLCAFVIKLSHLFISNVDFGNIPFKYNIIRGITICIWNKYDLLYIKECFTGKIKHS